MFIVCFCVGQSGARGPSLPEPLLAFVATVWPAAVLQQEWLRFVLLHGTFSKPHALQVEGGPQGPGGPRPNDAHERPAVSRADASPDSRRLARAAVAVPAWRSALVPGHPVQRGRPVEGLLIHLRTIAKVSNFLSRRVRKRLVRGGLLWSTFMGPPEQVLKLCPAGPECSCSGAG